MILHERYQLLPRGAQYNVVSLAGPPAAFQVLENLAKYYRILLQLPNEPL